MIEKYLKYIGYKKDPKKQPKKEGEEPETKEVYTPAEDIKVAERYLEYLKELDHYQKDRRVTIENKNSQLVGQASIVTSIFSLFVPLLIDSFNGITLYITIPLSLIFMTVLAHYSLTILHAINTLKINKYSYATRRTTTVTKKDRAISEIDFLNEEISDLVYSTNQSAPIDNKKGENLIFATRCFEIANFGFAILTIGILLSTFAIKKETPEINVKNLKEFNLNITETVTNRTINYPKLDSLTVKIDTTGNKLIIKNK
jgi:hypothetical protein